MNLKTFLSYRDRCPICNLKLLTAFHSKRRQIIEEDNNILRIFYSLPSLSFKIKYKVCYSINIEDNSIYVDFYNKKLLTKISIELLKDFRNFDNNLKLYRFYKYCDNCETYSYSSNSFAIDYKNCSIGDLKINEEIFSLYHNNKLKYRLYNNYEKEVSSILYGEFAPNWYTKILQVPLLKFSTQDKMIEKINKLIVFS
jgi:hypothetical protein